MAEPNWKNVPRVTASAWSRKYARTMSESSNGEGHAAPAMTEVTTTPVTNSPAEIAARPRRDGPASPRDGRRPGAVVRVDCSVVLMMLSSGLLLAGRRLLRPARAARRPSGERVSLNDPDAEWCTVDNSRC